MQAAVLRLHHFLICKSFCLAPLLLPAGRLQTNCSQSKWKQDDVSGNTEALVLAESVG